ncbi:cysteine desulfurase family protein [Moheibacter lacus]|uniref:cysteine desulfurase n=1 Tax=Moheibacter lacus TaxID=2745851 RepID=A0A838ZR51_9FLAO|nr:cysteine desulfurase family protein [Moheibacter lacus]MBA5628573.1 cysteine desulfurase [Moheibacter lacus]
MRKIYLDNAATTPIHEEVIDEMADCMKKTFGNPSSTHVFGREAKAKMELSRKKIAEALQVSPAEIVFTSCGTESNNLIIRSSVDHLGVKRIITSNLEHKCVKETSLEMGECRNVEVVKVKTDVNGSVDLEDLEKILKSSDQKTLVTLMHANNEIGNLLDVKKVQTLCEENAALFHTDTVQTLGHYPMDLSELKVDFASCSAHKIHGPKGIGFAYIKKSTRLRPQITGGGQERGLRSGTENVYGVVGLAKAFEMAIQDLDKHKTHIESLKKYTIDQLKATIPGVEFNGLSADLEKSLYTVLNIRLPFKDALIGFELELKGIAVSQGSACSSGAAKVSAVIESILTPEQIETTTPIRVSFSCYNTKEDIDALVGVLKNISEKHLVPH